MFRLMSMLVKKWSVSVSSHSNKLFFNIMILYVLLRYSTAPKQMFDHDHVMIMFEIVRCKREA